MKAIAVTCPHCGARLEVGDATDTVTCEYCGTASRVQRRTRIFERTLPPPPSRPDRPMQVAVQRRSPLKLVMVILSALVPVAITVIVLRTVNKAIDRATAGIVASGGPTEGSPRPATAPSWQATGNAIVADLDGDGTHEVLGRSRRVRAGDVVRLIALDTATGKPRWETESLGTYSDTYRGKLALAGDLVVFASPRGVVRAFAAATGKPRWSSQLVERVDRFCDGGTDHVIAVGVDRVPRRLRRADGAVDEPTDRKVGRRGRSTCAGLPNDHTERRSVRGDDRLGRRHGLAGARVVNGPGGRVLFGHRAKGTPVETLIALDDDDGERWKTVVARDPLGSEERAVDVTVVGDREVCAAYFAGSAATQLRVACFALGDGRRTWDEQVHRSLQELLIVDRVLLVSGSGRLAGFGLEPGGNRWTFGE